MCPFVNPARPRGRGAVDVAIYCRLPNGRVRVPRRDVTRRYCLPGAYEHCPTYLQHSSAG